MTSSTNYSEVNVRPRRYRGIRSSKKSALYSDYNTEEELKNGSLAQRSVSLTALPHNGTNSAPSTTPLPTPGPLLEPRMAQLETLEAKMASIEVSLSTTQRRKSGKKNGNGLISNTNKTSTFSGNSSARIFASIRSNTLTDTCRELEVLRNALKDKENTIQNLQGKINCCGRLTSLQPLDPSERRTAELKLHSLKQEEESRKSAIKKINLTLEEIDGNEANIDVRIKQAELEYELGREELRLLGVREEMRTLQARLDIKPTPTLYACVNSSGKYTLHCVQLEYDPKSPRFGADNVEDKIGLFVLWAAENSGLLKGDRILEINGKLTLTTSKEEMNRLLTVCPSKAEIVVFRAWTPPHSTEDFLRRENLRLTHRISYLEDQVSELLIFKEQSPLANKEPNPDKYGTEIFQKGSHVALLSAKPEKKADTEIITSDSTGKIGSDVVCTTRDSHQEKYVGSSDLVDMTTNEYIGMDDTRSCHLPVRSSQIYKGTDNYHIFQQKLCTDGGKLKSFTKKYGKDDFPSTLMKSRLINESAEEECNNRNFGHLFQSKNGSIQGISYSLSDLERPHTRPGDERAVDYSSETSCPRYKPQKEKKNRAVELSKENTSFKQGLEKTQNVGQQQSKPTPPKKPVRLSLNRVTSLQNVEAGYSLHNAVRKMKRSHKGEAPQPPNLYENKVNGSEESQYIIYDSTNSRASSRAESWKTPADAGRSNFRRSGSSPSNKNKNDEKWY